MKNDPWDLEKARSLRRNMTRQERKLWYDFLRNHPIKFYKQKPMGPYILDFYCPSRSLTIELDGGQHYEKENIQRDRERSDYLKKRNIQVIRFSNLDIDTNFEGVCTAIELVLTGPLSVSLTADSSPQGGEPFSKEKV